MIYMASILGITEIAIFSSYSIKLNNYLVNNYASSMSEFQIVRNSMYTDGVLLGLTMATIITYLFPISYVLIVFLIFNVLFITWMLYNWNFYSSQNL